jgi:hypothetical protein
MAGKKKRAVQRRDPKTLDRRLEPNQTPAEALAKLMAGGVAMNTVTAMSYSDTFGQLSLTECVEAVTSQLERVRDGDLAGLEAMLGAQAIALNAISTQLAHRTSKMTIVDQIDRFTRLALKAQGQCRATVETLALIKNPPAAVFARQANIAHGPQQVNNYDDASPALAESPARGENHEIRQNRLLGSCDEPLDGDPTTGAGRRDQTMATVGEVHRTADNGR